jgi:septum formation protein
VIKEKSCGAVVFTRVNNKIKYFSEQTVVKFKELTEEEIDFYVNKYKPFDKAGAYGIQEWIGAIGIENIQGDYYNVVGFPCYKFFELAKEITE